MERFHDRSSLIIINSQVKSNEECSGRSKNGLSWWIGALYLAGEMVGSGLLVLPKVLDWSGWIGIVVLVIFTCCVGYMALILGKCRMLLISKFPKYNECIRDPYTSLGFCAFGFPGRIMVAVCVKCNLFGGSVTLVLLGSQITQSILGFEHITYCHWVLIYGAVLTPLMWFATPKDFWGVGVGALLSTILVSALILVAEFNDESTLFPAVHSTPTFASFCKAFATISFIFGGIGIFPSVHNDMKCKNDYRAAAVLLTNCMLLLYLPISIISYMKYGSAVNVNVIMSLPFGSARTVIEILMVAHFLLAFLIAINPVCLEFEEVFNIPRHLCWKRCLVRSLMLTCIILVALSVPNFSKVMTLIGATFGTIATFVCPILLYFRLSFLHDSTKISLTEKTFLCEVFILAILGCFSASYFAIKEIFHPDTYTRPCFLS